MHHNVKKLFLRELRSGNHQQTVDFLRRGNKYSTLGLLCELYKYNRGRRKDRASWEGPYDASDTLKGETDAYCFLVGKEWSIELPSPTILKWAGITEEFAMEIYRMNDLQKLTFAQIADEIEKRLG